MDMDIQAGMQGYLLTEKYNIPLIVMEPIKGGALALLPDDILINLKNIIFKQVFHLGLYGM